MHYAERNIIAMAVICLWIHSTYVKLGSLILSRHAKLQTGITYFLETIILNNFTFIFLRGRYLLYFTKLASDGFLAQLAELFI